MRDKTKRTQNSLKLLLCPLKRLQYILHLRNNKYQELITEAIQQHLVPTQAQVGCLRIEKVYGTGKVWKFLFGCDWSKRLLVHLKDPHIRLVCILIKSNPAGTENEYQSLPLYHYSSVFWLSLVHALCHFTRSYNRFIINLRLILSIGILMMSSYLMISHA